MAPPFKTGPDVAISTAFFLAVVACILLLSYWFLWRKKQHVHWFVFVVPLIVTQGVHFGVYPEEVGSWLFSLTSASRGLLCIAITNACWWRALRLLRKDSSFPVTLRQRLWVLGYFCWIVFLCYSYVFEELGLKEADGSITHNIFTAFYFTTMTWTTVGYGDVLPHDGWTRFFAALAALNGYAVLAVLIATLLPIFMDGETLKSGHHDI